MSNSSPNVTNHDRLENGDIERQVNDIDNDSASSIAEKPNLEHIRSHVSNVDLPANTSPYREQGDEIYDKFTPRRKHIMTFVLAFCGFLAPISSTTVLSAIPEVAAQYNTTGDIINISNALYLVFMGLSPIFWGPIGNVYGRRWPSLVSAVLFCAFSIGTALAPNLVAFFIFRILTAFQGTTFLIIGSSCIGDIYRPTERATALGWFLSGTLIGPAFGPLLGGIIVTYRSWRVIFWLQTALAGSAVVLIAFLLPETIHYKRSTELKGLNKVEYAKKIGRLINPVKVVKLWRFPNLLLSALASSSLVWNMYSFLTPIRYVLNPRFNLTTPLQSGLFYLVPGAGYLIGTFMGGRWADRTVKKWIRKRGYRRPEDRLYSPLYFLGVVIPACMIIYGWSIEKAVGGVALPVVAMFIQGISQLFCFPALNTYCLDVMPGRSAEVIAGNYALRYFFGALGSALVLPAIKAIGVGWFSTISALFMVVAAGLTYWTALRGEGWRTRIQERHAQEAAEKAARKVEIPT